MRIISVNVNGIRAAHRKDFFKWLKKQNADVVCIQETKAQIAQLSEQITRLEGYYSYFNDAIKKGYDVEIDVWFEKENFYLGHDKPTYLVDDKYLLNKKLWCHSKNLDSLINLKKIGAHYFWHENDEYTLTSKGYIWTYPGKNLSNESICVLPEWHKEIKLDYKFKGICSDYIERYKNEYNKTNRI